MLLRRLNNKYNSILARLSMTTGLNLSKPSYVCAKMTMRCNSRCVHCNIWNMSFEDEELNTQQWINILDQLREWLGSFRMVFTGGEALLRQDMPCILAHAVNIGIEVELLSNSLLVDESLAQRVVAAGIDQITISLDGINPATHDRFRGGEGFYARTVDAIDSLCRWRGRRKKPLRILLKTVISSNNIDELAAVAEFARGKDVEVYYQPIEQNYGEEPHNDWYRKSPLWIHDHARLRGKIEELRALKRSGYPIVNTEFEFETIVRYFEHPERLMDIVQSHDIQTDSESCLHAVTNFVISINGDVRMCFRMNPIGNVILTSPKEIWERRDRCWTKPCDFR